jgi:hypothetical protein
LLRDQPALLITDIHLRAYNGLHLAHLARTTGTGTCTILFADPMDPMLAHEAQRIGAFVEWRHRIPFVVDAYLTARLPPIDRRTITSFDRRREFRGGRRAADVAAGFEVSASTARAPRSAFGSTVAGFEP